MAFDQKTRNLLQRTVSACRRILDEEFAAQRRSTYAIYDDGTAAPIDALAHLPDEEQQTARLLRDRLDHLVAGLTAQGKKEADARKEAVGRLTREQAFTVLNRLAALRMAEERDIVLECVRRGLQSDGFELFRQQAGSAFGDQFGAYQAYLSLLFDELAIDLGVLFDRHDPAGLLFPRKDALEAVLKELGGTGSAMAREEITPEEFNAIWSEDETIGWIYQYYNDPDERKKMREESAAPRNSRELAVRNQFFTPRYVVEFLTDNTLGRLWYEMTRGKTQLKDQCRYLVRRPNEIFLQSGESAPEQPKQDNLSQEELLRQPVHIPNRPLKDPRTILMLDPACGSMHFGLYAFDLFELIYDEAWGLEDKLGADALSRPPGVKSLHATYADKDAFLKDVPSLIIEQNIHGIDIDPRAAQIAGLSLWLRAQKAWQRLGLPPAERPAIKRSNIVCAEPMPGEKERLREFVASEFPDAERGVCLRLLEAIFDKMQLAGEAGSLLKIEEEIRSAIDDARDAWQKLATQPAELFTTTELNQISSAPELNRLEQAVSSLTTDPRHLTTDFWGRIEERIYAALRDYAEQAENGGGFQRRLFAEDAARGFAFIDVCRKRYDVVVMNPPFGEASKAAKSYIDSTFPRSKGNLLANFVELASARIESAGMLGAIVSRTCFFLKTFALFRESILNDELGLHSFADLGLGVLEAMVETAAATFSKESCPNTYSAFFRLVSESDRERALKHSISQVKRGLLASSCFIVANSQFRKLADSPYVYWVGSDVINRLASLPTIDPGVCSIRVGLQTGDDHRFLRLWHEVPVADLISAKNTNSISEAERTCLALAKGKKGWAWYSKTDEASPFIASIHMCVNWRNSGSEIKAFHQGNGHSPSKYVMSEDLYFRPGFSYMLRSVRLVPYVVPSGTIPTAGRSQVYPDSGMEDWLLILLASNLATAVARFRAENFFGPKFQNSMVGSIPFIHPPADLVRKGSEIVNRRRGELSRQFRADESEILFVMPQAPGCENLDVAVNRQCLLNEDFEHNVGAVYGLNQLGFDSLTRDLKDAVANGPMDESNPETSLEDAASANAFPAKLGYSVGCIFGRWDIRYATGERAAPELPDPFAPLPVCPPGQLQNTDGLPARPEDVPATYPVNIPWDGILVDDPEHPLDLERRVREVIGIIWNEGTESGGQSGDGISVAASSVNPDSAVRPLPSAFSSRAAAIEAEACEILGVKSLRDYFRKPAGFFADHLKRYSKSRRQAPIYWPLSTASGSYSLWIYYHRLTADTLYKCIQQFVEPKRKEVDAELDRLGRLAKAEEIGTKERRQMESLEELRRELADFQSELEHWAPRWKPNLNDGVLITACPLWKLFRLPKWQKDLKACWSELEKGDYDWAHLAFTLWPDRVREKCRKDRSLAIAHGREDICEVKAPEPKAKRARKAKKAPSGDLETAPLLDGTGATGGE